MGDWLSLSLLPLGSTTPPLCTLLLLDMPSPEGMVCRKPMGLDSVLPHHSVVSFHIMAVTPPTPPTGKSRWAGVTADCLGVPVTPNNGPAIQRAQNHCGMSWSLPCVTVSVTVSVTLNREGLETSHRVCGPQRREGEFLGKGAEDLGGCTAPLLLLVEKKFGQWNLPLN